MTQKNAVDMKDENNYKFDKDGLLDSLLNYQIILKKADITDTNTYADIISSAWLGTYKGMIPDCDLMKCSDIKHRREQFKNMLEKNMDIYIAKKDNKPFGVVTFCQNENNESSAYLKQLYLYPEYCYKGFGNVILSQVENIIKEKGYKKINLDCLFENKSSRRFYEKNGFLYKGTEDCPLFTQKVVSVFYEKEL